jgi:predicted nucleic acid-binding protein
VIVVDASTVAAWFFDDERDAIATQSAQRVLGEVAIVPAIFPTEVANALLFASRKGRIPKGQLGVALEKIRQLPLRVESQGLDLSDEMTFAIRYNLTVYDAMYLALAHRHNIELVTRDRELRAAAVDAGVTGQPA